MDIQKQACPVTLWLTGLSGAGKSTLAKLVVQQFTTRKLRVEVLDGDTMRRILSRGLGYNK